MSDPTIGVCPACDSADVYTRRPTTQGTTASDDHRHVCQACGHRFDEPHERERKSSAASIGKDTLARQLYDAKPEEVGRGD